MRARTAFTVGAQAAAAATPIAAALAKRFGIVDQPGDLKVHAEPVPYLGGLAVLAGLAGPVVADRPVLLVPIALAAGLGLADDVADLPPSSRLAVEVAIGAAVARVAPTGRGAWASAATIVGTVGLINGVNLVDGLDGLAVGTAGAGLAVLGGLVDGGAGTLAAAGAGACAGFLLHNRPPASIYLGDSGSYLLGTALAIAVASAWEAPRGVPAAIGSLGAISFVTVELATTVLRRRRAGIPLFAGDRSHTYDRLRDLGWPVARVSATYASAQLAVAAAAAAAARRRSVTATVAATAAAWALPALASSAVGRRHGIPRPG